MLVLVCVLPLVVGAAYTPGTPGATWSPQEVLAVKAKLRMTFKMGGGGSIRAAHEALGLPASARQGNINSQMHTEPRRRR